MGDWFIFRINFYLFIIKILIFSSSTYFFILRVRIHNLISFYQMIHSSNVSYCKIRRFFNFFNQEFVQFIHQFKKQNNIKVLATNHCFEMIFKFFITLIFTIQCIPNFYKLFKNLIFLPDFGYTIITRIFAMSLEYIFFKIIYYILNFSAFKFFIYSQPL